MGGMWKYPSCMLPRVTGTSSDLRLHSLAARETRTRAHVSHPEVELSLRGQALHSCSFSPPFSPNSRERACPHSPRGDGRQHHNARGTASPGAPARGPQGRCLRDNLAVLVPGVCRRIVLDPEEAPEDMVRVQRYPDRSVAPGAVRSPLDSLAPFSGLTAAGQMVCRCRGRPMDPLRPSQRPLRLHHCRPRF